ncbi:terminase large subunit domain-containing protein [Spirosoma fluminis]
MTKPVRNIRPQDGYQMKALSSAADIVIGGGAAGVGKTFSLLLEPLRNVNNKEFGAVCFRRTSPQIRAQGGLWDESMKLFPLAGGHPRESVLDWQFPSGAKISFRHLQHENDIYDWQGSQVPLLMFDEVTHFTEKMFFYMLSRNRSTCGVKPYVRATCNPDPESWVAKLIDWWIDPESGFPMPEREGVLRYFIKHGDEYIWGDSAGEVIEKAWFMLEELVIASGVESHEFVKSITFISGTIYDNKELLNVNPAYLGNLLSQDEQTMLQLLKGNWKVVISDKDIYDYPAFLGMFQNVYSNQDETRYITADIALQGSDKFIVGVWYGFELVDILIMPKSNGQEVVDGIKELAKKHKVQSRHIVYDNDGVGGFIEGFVSGAKAFHNGATPMEAKNDAGTKEVENYEHLKAQCYYRSGMRVRKGGYSISYEVANAMYDTKMTVRQRFMYERKAIKRDKADLDGKLKIIKKDEMKVKLGGQSPDMLDMFMMREYFELKPTKKWAVG